MMRRRIDITYLWLAVIAALAVSVTSCSTTRRLGADDVLYTGVKKIDIVPSEGEKVPSGVAEEVKNAVNVRPNNSLSWLSPYYRYPFPLGLWVYNNWSNPPKGFKHWLYEKLVEEPVLISDVRPHLRTRMIENNLDDAGYFRGTASYELLYNKKNKKKAQIIYTVHTGPAYLLDSIEYLPDTCHLYHKIDSVAMSSTYFRKGMRYSTDSLSIERNRITNVLRDQGYYFFRPEYIEYLADSTITPQRIALRITVARNIPKFALQRYRTGNVTVFISRNDGGGTPDTTVTRRGTVIQMMPSRLRKGLIPGCITFRKNRIFAVSEMNRTQSYLSRLGIFNYINIDAFPDTTGGEPRLDVSIQCTFDKPLEASIEANVSSKSNSYLGPGLSLWVTNRNLFGGGEQLRVGLTGSYEWQTGHDRSSVFNSYEVGINSSLSFPRMLAPRFFPLSRRNLNWTRFTLNADLLNRPHYFNMAQFSASMNYDWQTRKYFSYTFTPLKLSYVKLLRTTSEFDSIMAANPAVAVSFRDQFIPQMGFTMIYDRVMNRDNLLNVQATVQEAGNICWGIWRIAGVKGEKRLFGMPFSQFIKSTAQIVYSRRIKGEHWFVARMFGGVAHAYGNGHEVPYSEQFYVGGANSVRAFTVRSIGPGSYHPDKDDVNSNFDETGTFKFECNAEYRFPIFGPVHGAFFLDAGNVWLLKNDPNRPGGKLEGRTFFRDLAVGTGVGLRFDISMLVIRGDLGIGIHAPYDTGHGGYYNMESFKKSLAFHLAIGYPF